MNEPRTQQDQMIKRFQIDDYKSEIRRNGTSMRWSTKPPGPIELAPLITQICTISTYLSLLRTEPVT